MRPSQSGGKWLHIPDNDAVNTSTSNISEKWIGIGHTARGEEDRR